MAVKDFARVMGKAIIIRENQEAIRLAEEIISLAHFTAWKPFDLAAAHKFDVTFLRYMRDQWKTIRDTQRL